MTLKQAADALGITAASLRQAIARGTLTATKLGRDWFVSEAEVERYRTRRTPSGADGVGAAPLPDPGSAGGLTATG